jgi:hypothetical protein
MAPALGYDLAWNAASRANRQPDHSRCEKTKWLASR